MTILDLLRPKPKNVINMTQEEFDKLTERDLSISRGDKPEWETEWVVDTTFERTKLTLYDIVSRHTKNPVKAARATNRAFEILFHRPREVRYVP